MLSIINTLWNEIVTQTSRGYSIIVKSLPNILIALAIIIIGYFVAILLGFVTKRILYKFDLDHKFRKTDLDDSLGQVSFANFAGKLVKWVVFILFLTHGVSYISFGVFSGIIKQVIYWIPNLIVGVLIIIFGWITIDFTIYKILELKWKYTKILVHTTKVILLFIIAITALDHIGINISFMKNVFLILFAAICLALALIAGISLGFGLREEARYFIKKLKRKK